MLYCYHYLLIPHLKEQQTVDFELTQLLVVTILTVCYRVKYGKLTLRYS